MRILIVHCWSLDEKGIKLADHLEMVIRKEFATQQEALGAEIDFTVRHSSYIDDFLYDVEAGFSSRDHGMQFDHTDMIFLAGPSTILPWSPAARKVLILLKMCFTVQKKVFASGLGFQSLVFLAASNYANPHMNIINGLHGSSLKELEGNVHKWDVSKMRSTDYFLDSRTGDFYGFNHSSGVWAPCFNGGFHLWSSFENITSDIVGKFNLTITKPLSVNVEGTQTRMKTRSDEVLVRIRKLFLQHWAVQNMPSEFLICSTIKWISHPFNFTNPGLQFKIIAESRLGPQIIVFKNENILACLYNVENRYKETRLCLRNFIRKKIAEIHSDESNTAVTILKQEFSNTSYGIAVYKSPEPNPQGLFFEKKRLKPKKKQGIIAGLFTKETQNEEPNELDDNFHHVGFAATRKGLYAVRNNFINLEGKSNVDKRKGNTKNYRGSHSSKHGKMVQKDEGEMEEELSFMEDLVAAKRTLEHCKNLNGKTLPNHSEEDNGMTKMEPRKRIRCIKIVGKNKGFATDRASNPSFHEKLLRASFAVDRLPTERDIRLLILPHYDPSNCPEKRVVIPRIESSLSCSTVPKTHLKSNLDTNTKKPIIRIKETPRPYCRLAKNKDYEENLFSLTEIEAPLMTLETPYLTPVDIERKIQKEKDKLIIGPKKFVAGSRGTRTAEDPKKSFWSGKPKKGIEIFSKSQFGKTQSEKSR